MSKYQELAGRTVSPHFYNGSVPALQLLGMLELMSVSGEYADQQKRAFFYGQPYKEVDRIRQMGEFVYADVKVEKSPRIPQDLLHALLGLQSEIAEIADALLDSIKSGEELDEVNLAEEAGDLRWYLALLATSLGRDEEEIEHANIEKLRKRFPDKFTEEAAAERDLEGERMGLEELFCEGHKLRTDTSGDEKEVRVTLLLNDFTEAGVRDERQFVLTEEEHDRLVDLLISLRGVVVPCGSAASQFFPVASIYEMRLEVVPAASTGSDIDNPETYEGAI